ncbi:hypothetical protein M422DRAFT_254350 [Sphaerobolus stellatus SS14]|uniref:Unplaced genomic scaffold SPHSTscaffold_54, whole genome shotgun sequence n=1 Tax=Sphaerobolus stellatus (strain SS14) TaxID=990650 RepID=A0A0C9VLF3_SPHS4|nr:hypothetical protein M422DRAFT_254350 [Sphaerobolus stellatus SS14]
MLADFGRARARIAFLLSLRQLTLNAKNAQYASLFNHPDLVKLVVHLDARFLEAWGMTGINNFLLELPTFSPGLQALVIRASYSVTKIQATSFHNLSDLNLEIDIPVAHRFLASSGLFKQLSSFSIRTDNALTPSHLHDLLQVFFENGSILKKLYIDGFPNSPRTAEKESIVTSETLEAILDSSQLTHLSFYWPARLPL